MTRTSTRRYIARLLTLLGMVLPTMVWCAPSVPNGYRFIANEYDIPYTLLYAVAFAESGVVRMTRGYAAHGRGR